MERLKDLEVKTMMKVKLEIDADGTIYLCGKDNMYMDLCLCKKCEREFWEAMIQAGEVMNPPKHVKIDVPVFGEEIMEENGSRAKKTKVKV